MAFSATLPVNPSVTITSTVPESDIVTLDEAMIAAGQLRLAQERVGLTQRIMALLVFRADIEQGNRRLERPSTVRANTLPMTANWNRFLASQLTFAPRSSITLSPRVVGK